MSIDAISNHFFRVGVTQSLKKHGMSPSAYLFPLALPGFLLLFFSWGFLSPADH